MRSSVNANWSTTVLVCAKCSKKLDGGFGEKGRTSLAKALKALGGGKKRKAPFGVIETRCLGLCPKGAVVAVNAALPGTWHLIRPGTPIADAVETLAVRGVGES